MNRIIKIGTLEAIGFMIVVMINRIILNTPKEIINSTGTSAWVNVIVVSIVAIIFVLIICRLYKNFAGQDIIDISKYLGGNVLKIITSIIFFSLFVFTSVVVLRNFSDSLQTIFLENTPIAYIILFFAIAMIIANKLGITSIIKINVAIIILILLNVIIIFLLPISHFNISNLLPVLGYGTNETFFSGLTNLFAFSGIAYLYFIMPFLYKPENFKKIAITAVIISSIYLFLSVISLLGLFSYLITSEDVLSILLITRIISFGTFIQRIDAVFVLTWILTFMSYLSILLFFAMHTLKKITNVSNHNGMVYSIMALIVGLALLPKNIIEVNFLENNILKYLILIFIFVFPFILLVLANLKYKKKNKLKKAEVNF